MSGGVETMNSFVLQAVNKLYKASSRKHKELREEIERIRTDIAGKEAKANAEVDTNADKYFYVLKLACNTASAKLKGLALDCIQKLIAFGYLNGNSPVEARYAQLANTNVTKKSTLGSMFKKKPQKPSLAAPEENKNSTKASEPKLIDVMIETIYECAMYDNDNVQLQVINALLTSVTSVSCQVHERSLLYAVRACYHIYLMSRNMNNQTTAKATLTQTLNIIFQRMDHYSSQLKQIEKRLQGCAAEDVAAASELAKTQETKELSDKEILQRVATKAAPAPQSTKDGGGKFGTCLVCKRPANHYCLQTKDPVCSMECKVQNFDNFINNGQMDAQDNVTSTARLLALKTRVAAKYVVLSNDAYLLFCYLCKLSMKVLPYPPEPLALRSKTLSLELLLSILSNTRLAFRTSAQFIGLVREELITSLMKNLVTQVESIFRLASSIFVTLVAHFKVHLKREIGVFLHTIFIGIMDNQNSTYAHKMMALKVFYKLCGDPQTIVEIFLNYDCEEGGFDVFQKTLSALEKLALGRFIHENWMSNEEASNVKLLALRCVVACENSLVWWTEKAAIELKKNPVAVATAAAADQEEIKKTDVTAASAATTRFSEGFQRNKLRKQVWATGIMKFNMKAKKGVAYLQEHGLIGPEPKDIADFLFDNFDKLNKTLVGDYIGEKNEPNHTVMNLYIDKISFYELDFDVALRNFLNYFRLPVEAEKVDRILEKFGNHFHDENPRIFNHGATAYVLAFSTMMLHTDAHSDAVKDKMTLAQFISTNRGIDEGQNIDPKFLTTLYNNIKKKEIKLKGDPNRRHEERKALAALHPKKRLTVFAAQVEELVAEAEVQRRGGPKGEETKQQKTKPVAVDTEAVDAEAVDTDAVETEAEPPVETLIVKHAQQVKFHTATVADVASLLPMFDIVFFPSLALFSVILEDTEDEKVVKQCLSGYELGIRGAIAFKMETARVALVSSLKKFTLLGSGKEMKNKNIEAIKMLLSIAYKQGNNLESSWREIMECLSEFEALHLIGMNQQPNVDIFQISTVDNTNRAKSGKTQAMLTKRQQDARTLTLNSLQVVAKIDSALIDRVFTQSANLNSTAIIDFVNALKQVSQDELQDRNAPRVYCLQKMVEITYYNMNRKREVWSNIWNVLGEYFDEAGCHPNLNVSMYAIDSLRQLSMKFLEREELAQEAFQVMFLNPFLHIMQHSTNTDAKELVIQCLGRIILAKLDGVQSGWRVLFKVLGYGSQQAHIPLINSSYALVKNILSNNFQYCIPVMDDCVSSLVAFCSCSLPECSQGAIEMLSSCLDHVASKLEAKDDTDALNIWLSVVAGLSRIVSDHRLETRLKALDLLFINITTYGHLLSQDQWLVIFETALVPLFANVDAKVDRNNKAWTEWVSSTCFKALSNVISVFTTFSKATSFLTTRMLTLLGTLIAGSHTELAKIGTIGWSEFILSSGPAFTAEQWTEVLTALKVTFDSIRPVALRSGALKQMLGIETKKKPLTVVPTEATTSTPEQDESAAMAEADATGPRKSNADTSFASMHDSLAPSSTDLILPLDSASVSANSTAQLLLTDAVFKTLFRFYAVGETKKAATTTAAQDLFFSSSRLGTAHFGDLAGEGKQSTLSYQTVLATLELFTTEIQFYHAVNQDVSVRQMLHKAGVTLGGDQKRAPAGPGLPNLFYHEARTAEIVSQTLFRLYNDSLTLTDLQQNKLLCVNIEQQLLEFCFGTIDRYVGSVSADGAVTEATATPNHDIAICEVLSGVLTLGDAETGTEVFQKHFPVFFPKFVKLIEFGSVNMRKLLAKVFNDRVAPLITK